MNIVVYFVVFGIFGYFEIFVLVSSQLNTYQDPMKCPAERCYCYADEDLECTDLLLTSVPNFYHTKYTRNITYALLDLSENKIKEIQPWAFADLSLRSIKIWRNHKKTDLKLYGDSFQGLNDCLEKLNLKKNNISKLPKASSHYAWHLDKLAVQQYVSQYGFTHLVYSPSPFVPLAKSFTSYNNAFDDAVRL
ncbi:hypothetical protein HELRODRAFT_168039 [Helobdella robusta]|uniref:LRRNT domain-containing protein n=1 Tax=Helobdella robusta TaxID=6412 RepID=T1F036_HELRO|nr:hypothetical protein HELRODRAFT_168039 [Helobdella robusta]ESO10171.1 hypothetical protein HELRODRAFT_168039 [Helobdella robusta]